MSLGSGKRRRAALGLAAVGLAIVVGLSATGYPRMTGVFTNGGDESKWVASPSHGRTIDGCGESVVPSTLWADKIDVFLERPHIVAGKAVDLLFHLTLSSTSGPITEGSLTLIATGPEQVEIRSEKPARPGVFVPRATFMKPGEYRVYMILKSSQVEGGGESIELQPVAVHASADDALAAARISPNDRTADAVHFLKEQQWRVGLKTHVARMRELIERLVVPGRVIVPQGSGAIVGSPITGNVSPPSGKSFPKVGDRVEKGQLLAVVEPSIAGAEAVQLAANRAQLQTLDTDLAVRQLEIETRLRRAELSLRRAQDSLKRKKKLTEDGVTAGKELIATEYEVHLGQAEVDGLTQVMQPYRDARERLATVLGRMQESGEAGDSHGNLRVALRSPMSGTIVEANITAGELIHNDRRLFYLVNLDALWIEARVSEYDLARIRHAPGASFRLASYPDSVMPITAGGGRLIDIGAVVDPDTRTVPIRYEIPNPDGMLRVGMYADLLMETDRRQTALAVPKDAVLNEGGETVVYLQRGGETFERRHVEVGIRDGDLMEIRNGLAVGDRVVTKGAFTIRLATLSSAMSTHGHAH